jgi:uncharacterized protein YceK
MKSILALLLTFSLLFAGCNGIASDEKKKDDLSQRLYETAMKQYEEKEYLNAVRNLYAVKNDSEYYEQSQKTMQQCIDELVKDAQGEYDKGEYFMAQYKINDIMKAMSGNKTPEMIALLDKCEQYTTVQSTPSGESYEIVMAVVNSELKDKIDVSGGYYSHNGDGYKFLCLGVRLMNRTGGTLFISPLNFTLTDSDGRNYSLSSTTYAFNNYIQSTNVTDSGFVEGYMIFDVIESSGYTLIYNDGKYSDTFSF